MSACFEKFQLKRAPSDLDSLAFNLINHDVALVSRFIEESSIQISLKAHFLAFINAPHQASYQDKLAAYANSILDGCFLNWQLALLYSLALGDESSIMHKIAYTYGFNEQARRHASNIKRRKKMKQHLHKEQESVNTLIWKVRKHIIFSSNISILALWAK